jgi:uncharacterized phage protein gp47/JayE
VKLIPKNNLDDRTFKDIVDEAIRLIPRYCPEWTNHNPSDPGITLIELFAWMTELTLYRLNQVPEKTYLSLLELMGLSLIPPQAARAVIQFFPVDAYKKAIVIKKGTQISAVTNTEETFLFETEQDISVLNNKLVACIYREGEQWTDYCTDNALQSFSLFETKQKVEHILYIASPSFAHLAGEHSIQITFKAESEILSVQDEIINFLSWEYWDGRSWTEIDAKQSIEKKKKKDNVRYISGPFPIQSCEVHGSEGFFLRTVLNEVPEHRNALIIKDLSLETYFGGLGFIPENIVSNSGSQYFPLDMNNHFRIFSENPEYNETAYISADDIFSRRGNEVTIIFLFSEFYVPGNENEHIRYRYEYWDGNSWSKIGESPSSAEADNLFHFKDKTFAFKQSGEVQFIIPENIQSSVVNGEDHYWIRIRLLSKDFSLGGAYEKDEKDNWIWRFSSKDHSPIFDKIRLRYNAGPQWPEKLFSFSNFQWNDLGHRFAAQNIISQNGFPLVDIMQDDIPSLFFGFFSPFVNGNTSLYIKINDEKLSKPKDPYFSFFNDKDLFSSVKIKRQIDLSWEYWNGKEWSSLAVNDFTDSFHESGFIEFSSPVDIARKKEFAKELYWIRLRFISGSFESEPEIESILTNAVYARNTATYVNEIVGSGTGAPSQSFRPAHSPLLPGIDLLVDEASIPPAIEIEIMKREGIMEPYYVDGESVWVRYKEVNNFYASNSLSRHFMVDYRENVIHFGDGQRGINPPRKKFNIKIASYSTGGAANGNLAAGMLRTPIQSIPFIAGCDNPFPAEGGADMETVNNLKSRAAGVFKSLQRAVTAEDFQWLAREASSSVGRAWCLKERNSQGEICIAVVPLIPSGETLSYKLIPSRELIRRVKAYLDERKLVGSKMRVQEPHYRSFNIALTLVFKSDVLDAERLKKQIDNSLRSSFHALLGGSGDGWEFGKAVTVGTVLKQLEKTEGILSVDSLRLFDSDAKVVVDTLILKEDELPYLEDVAVENRREMQ